MKKLKKWFASLFPNEVHVIFPLVRNSKESHEKLVKLIETHQNRGDDLHLTICDVGNKEQLVTRSEVDELVESLKKNLASVLNSANSL